MQDQRHGDYQGGGKQQKVDELLAFVSQRPLRQNFLKLAGSHQAAGNGQAAENDLERQHRHHEARDIGCAQVKFGGADQRYAERSKGVTERGSLRDRRHRYAPERNADDGAEHKPNGDQPVIHNAVVQQRAADRQQHADFARPDAVAGRGRRTHPLQREDEQHARDEIQKLDEDLASCEFGCHYWPTDLAAGLAAGRLDLNIFNMRSVIRKPPTMLLVAATTAINPKTAESVLLCSPTSTIAPTTAIASKALVSDINGVCSSGETRRITSNPMNPASTKIKSALIRFELLFIFPPSDFPSSWRAGRPARLDPSTSPSAPLGASAKPGRLARRPSLHRHFASTGKVKNSRTRAFTISPPWVRRVSRTISSARFRFNFLSFMRGVR